MAFRSFWLELKPKITFVYTSLPYDPDKKSLKQSLARKKEIEEIILERSEAMWRNLFDDEFGLTRFYFGDVELTARVWQHSTVCRIDLLTKKYQKDCQKIEAAFFNPKTFPNGDWKSEYKLSEVIKNYKNISGFNFKIVNKDFEIENIIDAIGKGLDPSIKPLVKVLNQLDITTTASCGGHTDHGMRYPWIDISTSAPAWGYLIRTLNQNLI